MSERGDILSPRKAPDTIAPAVISKGIPTWLAIIINDTPIVPIDVNDVPVIIATILVTSITIGIKFSKLIILNPQYTIEGIIPPIIQLLTISPTKITVNSAGNTLFNPFPIAFSISFRLYPLIWAINPATNIPDKIGNITPVFH